MSDNKKYYYIKLKDNYFDQDNIKILESVPNGHVYSLIIVKLYLKATKYGGQLRMTESIPYDPSKMDILASVLNHDVAHVKEAIKLASDLGIVSILDTGDMWMAEIQNFIGQSSSEADRIRDYRSKLNKVAIENKGQSVQMYDKSTPKREIEKEIELKKDIELEFFESVWKLLPSKMKKGKKAIMNSKVKLKFISTMAIDTWVTLITRYDNSVTDKNYLMQGSTFFNTGYFDYLDENYEQQETIQSKEYDKEPRTQQEREYFRQLERKDKHSDLWNDEMEKRLSDAKIRSEQSLQKQEVF